MRKMALTLAVMLVATLLIPAISFAGDRYGGQSGYRGGSYSGYRGGSYSGYRSGSYSGYRGGYGRGGYGYGGHGGYRHQGHNFGEAFLGTTLGVLTGGIIYNALTPTYVYVPPPDYQPSYYQPAYNQPSEYQPAPEYQPTPECQPTSECQPSYDQSRYRQPAHRQPANRRPMCAKIIENGYWDEDCEGNQYWVQTGADRKLIVPCD